MSYSCHQQWNKQDEGYERFGGHRHSQGWLDQYTTCVAAKTHSEVPGLVEHSPVEVLKFFTIV